MKRALILAACLSMILYGCKEKIVDAAGDPLAPGAAGVYVLNEGNFGDPEGARLSFYDSELDTVFRDVVETANSGLHLGSLGDDIKISGGDIYTLMSGSENITVLDPASHAVLQTGSFPGSVPHEMVIDPIRSRIYMTELFANSILVVDLTTLTEILTIPVGLNPQGMELVDNLLFVCNSGFGADSTVTVVDVDNSTAVRTIPVGDGPIGARLASDGRVWVACQGDMFGAPPTNGSVYVINPVSMEVEDSLLFSENLWGLIEEGPDGSIYVLGVTPSSFSGGPLHRITPAGLSVEMMYIPGTYYAMAVDQPTGRIYLGDAAGFIADGEVLIFESDGTAAGSFAAQLGPGSFAFKR